MSTYAHPVHGEVFVARNAAGLYVTAYRLECPGTVRRVKSPMMPPTPDMAEAQANLDRWATAAKLERM